ncbi:hypothetical protein Q7A53_15170 [Halobacillus rhizosphaerae]|uniref:hypothetical protein n=1 Tax=Halobacillus rhizosphaerae TaxID=3064889 RepID=UPI00398AC0CC
MDEIFGSKIIFSQYIKKYEKLILFIISEMGVTGKEEDFLKEGLKIAVKENVQFNSKQRIFPREDYIEFKIREHFRSILGIPCNSYL